MPSKFEDSKQAFVLTEKRSSVKESRECLGESIVAELRSVSDMQLYPLHKWLRVQEQCEGEQLEYVMEKA